MTNGEGSGQTPSATKRRNLLAGRLQALSDGVFAIAVTLPVLEIAVPGHARTGHERLNSVARLSPSYLAYVVSFSTIGAVWLGHSAITEYLERIDGGFIRLNLLGLLVPVVAVGGYLAIALYYIFPFKHRTSSRYRAGGRADGRHNAGSKVARPRK
jgi:transmembrane protein TMEM174 (potassium channel)